MSSAPTADLNTIIINKAQEHPDKIKTYYYK